MIRKVLRITAKPPPNEGASFYSSFSPHSSSSASSSTDSKPTTTNCQPTPHPNIGYPSYSSPPSSPSLVLDSSSPPTNNLKYLDSESPFSSLPSVFSWDRYGIRPGSKPCSTGRMGRCKHPQQMRRSSGCEVRSSR